MTIIAVVATLVFNTMAAAPGLAVISTTMSDMADVFKMVGVGMIIFLFGVILVTAVFAAMIGSHPALGIIGVLLMPVVILFSAALSMAWTALATSPAFAATAASMPYLSDVYSNLVLIVLLAYALIVIALYAGYKSGVV